MPNYGEQVTYTHKKLEGLRKTDLNQSTVYKKWLGEVVITPPGYLRSAEMLDKSERNQRPQKRTFGSEWFSDAHSKASDMSRKSVIAVLPSFAAVLLRSKHPSYNLRVPGFPKSRADVLCLGRL